MKPNDLNNNGTQNEIIELNVGGCAYTTSRTTIDSYPDSMLVSLISERVPTATDTKKRIFIDRDGPLFRYILNFLRDKRLSLPENFAEHSQLRQEADFYGIEPIINYLDSLYNTINKRSSLISGSMQSLVSTTSNTTMNESISSSNIGNNKPVYFTIVSKLYQGSLESYIGCIKVLGSLVELDSNSKKFMKYLTNQHFTTNDNNTKNEKIKSSSGGKVKVDSFVCECKFIHEDKIICCKPCGLTGTTSGSGDQQLISLCQSVVRVAKQFGMTTGYWDDMFYLCVDQSVPNREQLSSVLAERHSAKLLSSCMSDRRSNYDEQSKSSLVERWHIAPLKQIKTSTKE